MPNQRELPKISEKDLKRFLNTLDPYSSKLVDFNNFSEVKVVVEKTSRWQRFTRRVARNPWPYILFCMQMAWPAILLGWLIIRGIRG